MKLKLMIFYLLLLFLFAFSANAGEWNYSLDGQIQGLYGYSSTGKHNNGVGRTYIESSASYLFDNDDVFSLNFNLMGAINQEIQDYNQGRWGEEVYIAYDSLYGQLMLGQVFNVASLFHNGVSFVGAINSYNDVADFIVNPNWRRTAKNTEFATLNATDINTDGVAAKINYITPEFYGTAFGFSYIPNSYNRRGLINKHAEYAHDDGFVGAVYNDYDWGFFSTQASFGYAQYHGNDKEFSYSLNIKRGNWNIGGGFRKTYIDGDNKIKNLHSLPEGFDYYREGFAWNIGIGYEIGPFSSSLSYFESKASDSNNDSNIFVFSNEYQINKNIDFYFAVAHVDFTDFENTDKGYTFVTGLGVSF